MLHLDTNSLLVLCPICTFLSQSCTNVIHWKCKNSYQKVGFYLFICNTWREILLGSYPFHVFKIVLK